MFTDSSVQKELELSAVVLVVEMHVPKFLIFSVHRNVSRIHTMKVSVSEVSFETVHSLEY